MMASKDNQSGTYISSSEMEESIKFSTQEIHSRGSSVKSLEVGKGKAEANKGPVNPPPQAAEPPQHVPPPVPGAALDPPPPAVAGVPQVQPAVAGVPQVQPVIAGVPQVHQAAAGIPQGQPPQPNFLKFHCIPDLEGKPYRWACTCISLFIFCLASIGLLSLLLVVIAFEVNLHKTHEVPKAAFQAMDLSQIVPQVNLLSKEICITDLNPTSGITVSLAQERCLSNVSTEESTVPRSIASPTQDENPQGLLFYWLEGTQFELNITLNTNEHLYVRLLKSTEHSDKLLGKCADPDPKTEPVVQEWVLPNPSLCVNNGPCSIAYNVSESHYYYLCFDGQMVNFTMNMRLLQYDYNRMETCTAVADEPCCMSYSSIFTELNRKSSTCVYLISNLTYIPREYLTKDVTKISVTTKIGARWWVFAVLLFLTVVAVIVTGVLCAMCFLSKKQGEYRDGAMCRHICVWSCYRLRYRLQYEAI